MSMRSDSMCSVYDGVYLNFLGTDFQCERPVRYFLFCRFFLRYCPNLNNYAMPVTLHIITTLYSATVITFIMFLRSVAHRSVRVSLYMHESRSLCRRVHAHRPYPCSHCHINHSLSHLLLLPPMRQPCCVVCQGRHSHPFWDPRRPNKETHTQVRMP